MISTNTFITQLRHAFGENMKLPFAVWYSETPAGEEATMPHCMFEILPMVEQGSVLSFSKEKLHCGGGRIYSGFNSYTPAIGKFVSGKEFYKQTPEMVDAFVESLDIHLAEKPYFNFARIDKLQSLDNIEGLVFMGNADVISGLSAWAFFDNNDKEAVSCQWASGCSAILTLMTNENRLCGRRTFLGMFDLSVRKWVEPNEMSFGIPLSRLKEMTETLPKCALYNSPTWQTVKDRINSNKQE